MTREIAINFLSQVKDIMLRDESWLESTHKPIKEAFDMAIKALTKEAWKEEHPVSPLLQKLATNLQPSKQDDVISRHAAIDAILAVTGNSSVRELYEHVQEHELSDMWSGGVNAAIDIIIAVPPVHPEPCEDTISRKAAIDAVKHAWAKGLEPTQYIEDLPSAQPLVLTCDGCRHVGTYDTDFPCSGCIRREKDYYEQER